jgi:rSAM/selenodomain-associated transferase 1
MSTVALAILCKTPIAGESKTRLSPPLDPTECAELSACFITDLSNTIQTLIADGDVTGYAVYTPKGSESQLRPLLPPTFEMLPQCEGDFGARLIRGIDDLLARGHAGAILTNSDSPTLPRHILRAAVDAVRRGDNVVLGPAVDGGYTLVGVSRPHHHLFTGIPWSTDAVLKMTLEKAGEINLPAVLLDPWYDVDDAASYTMLEQEFAGLRPAFGSAATPLQDAPRTREFLSHRYSHKASM